MIWTDELLRFFHLTHLLFGLVGLKLLLAQLQLFSGANIFRRIHVDFVILKPIRFSTSIIIFILILIFCEREVRMWILWYTSIHVQTWMLILRKCILTIDVFSISQWLNTIQIGINFLVTFGYLLELISQILIDDLISGEQFIQSWHLNSFCSMRAMHNCLISHTWLVCLPWGSLNFLPPTCAFGNCYLMPIGFFRHPRS